MKEEKPSKKEVTELVHVGKRLQKSEHVKKKEILSQYICSPNLLNLAFSSYTYSNCNSDSLATIFNLTVLENSRAKSPNANKINHGKSAQENLIISSPEHSWVKMQYLVHFPALTNSKCFIYTTF